MYDECEYVAGKIKHLVIEKGYLYSDISVICHDTEPYRGVLSEILEKYEIPYFSDEHADIDVKPVIRFVNSIFRCLIYDFDREDVLALLKSGLTEFSVEEISLFENYLFVWNVSGSAFKINLFRIQKAILTGFRIMTERFLQRLKICVNQLLNRYFFSKKMQRIKTDLKFQSCSMPFLKNLKFPMRYAECMRNLNARTINRWVRSR